jgi:hypothetical protein
MTTMEIGTELVTLIRSGKSIEAMEKLYAKDILSIEAAPMPDREVRGLDKCIEKSKAWVQAHEIHGATVEGPFPHGDKFALILSYDITRRAENKRIAMKEVAVYTVAGDKIVREEFMYPT